MLLIAAYKIFDLLHRHIADQLLTLVLVVMHCPGKLHRAGHLDFSGFLVDGIEIQFQLWLPFQCRAELILQLIGHRPQYLLVSVKISDGLFFALLRQHQETEFLFGQLADNAIECIYI